LSVKTFAVLADTRRGSLPLLTHAAFTENNQPYKALCHTVKLASLADLMADDPEKPPTCPTCANRDPRAALTEYRSQQNRVSGDNSGISGRTD
jgi:hypothetical protein